MLIELPQEIMRDSGLAVRRDVPLSRHTTIAIGGPASFVIVANEQAALARTLAALSSAQIPVRVLGAGSNLLISDNHFAGAVLKLGPGFRGCADIGAGCYEVGAAEPLMSLSRSMAQAGLEGLEFAGGIPASFGGAVRMNAGAHGHELGELLERVHLILPSGEVAVMEKSSLELKYRSLKLPTGAIVTKAVIRLTQGDPSRISERRQEFLTARKRTQPLTLPSCGSVFKNPGAQLYAGQLIERVGLKGTTRGGAQISELHANWIVNRLRQAKFSDVMELISLCQQVVREREGVQLDREVVVWE